MKKSIRSVSSRWVLIEANIAMLFMSTSGPLGRYISLPPYIVICVRCLLSALFLFVLCKVLRTSMQLRNRKDFFRVALVGILLVSHWTLYFLALQLSNVAVGMLTLFTYPVMAAILEPLFLKTRFQPIHLAFGIIGLVGVILLLPSLDFGNSIVQGAFAGLLSALVYVFRNLLLKPISSSYSALPLMFYQLLIGGLVMSPLLFWWEVELILDEWQGLILLAVITTVVGHTLFVKVLKHYSVTSVSILTTVQPVYGILMGLFFLAEVPSPRAILGGLLILLTVVLESIRNSIKSNS